MKRLLLSALWLLTLSPMAPAQQQPDFSLAFVSLSDLKAAGAPSVAVAPTPRPVLVDQWTKSVEYSVLLKQNGWQGWNYSSTGRHPEIEWVQAHTQPSSEYRQLCEKAFRIGWDAVAKAVKSRPGRLAVVLDIDETVMINATFQRELGDGPFDPKKWEEWVRRKEAAAVPGAKEFLDKARGVGMRVVFMSDRSSDLDAFTVENLKKHGLFVEGDVVLSKTSKTDTKDVRRSCVSAGTTGADARCKTFEPMTIIATFGDSLRDHVEVYGLEAARRTLGDYNWGKTRFVLPNPMYGQWATDYK